MKRRPVLILLVLTALPSWTLAQLGPQADVTWTLTVSAVSQYMFRGLRYGGPSLQPMIESDRGNLGLGVWASTPLANRVPGRSDPEIDPYGWYRIAVSDACSIQPGFTVYTYPDADRVRGFYRATFEPSLAMNYTWKGIVVTPKLYYDLTLRGPTAELNAAYAIPLRSLGTELDLNANAGAYEWNATVANRDPGVKNTGDYWSVGATVPYQITRTSKLSVGFGYTRGWNNYLKQGTAPHVANPSAAGRGIVTLSYALTF